MTMKAKDLMIGDLIKTDSVSWPDETLRDRYCKVEYVGHGYLRCSLVDEPEREPYGEDISFEPIRLTPEILEKNGFEKNWQDNFDYYNEDIGLIITFHPKETNYTNGAYNYIDIEKGCMTIYEMPIEFVHQLQHALWLCDVNEEFIV